MRASNSFEDSYSQQGSSTYTKESLFSAPLRPSSMTRVSGDHSQSRFDDSPAIIAVNEEKRTEKQTKVPVDEGSVTISMKDTKFKDETITDPQLVSYKKISSPNLGNLKCILSLISNFKQLNTRSF